jgi:hypothetical protein
MAGIQFIRRDFVIRLRSTKPEPGPRYLVQTGADGRRRVVPLAAAEAGLEIRINDGATANSWTLPAHALAELSDAMPAVKLAKVLWGDPKLRAELEHWQKSRSPAVWGVNARPDEDAPIDRICLRVESDRLVALALEQSLRDVLSELGPSSSLIPPIPRLISVPPRVLQVPLTLPLRLLQLDPRGDFDLRSVVRDVLGRNAQGRGSASITQVASGDSRRFASWALPPKWRTVDVLHLDRARLATEDDLFLMSAPEKPGTLGWLVRCADVWRTRLVVLRGNGFAEMVALRRLAHRLAAQGGPAVALFDASVPAASEALRQFYVSLLHDAPIDVAAAIASAALQVEPPTLLLGAGRGELPRVSTPAAQLASMASDLGHSDPGVRAGAAGNLWSLIAGNTADVGLATTLFARAGRGLLGIASDLPSWRFDLHEGASMVPLGKAIGLLRLNTRTAQAPTSPLRPTADQTGPRFVNLDLSRPGSDRSREKIPQSGGRLRPDEAVVLGVQLGPRSDITPVLDAVALIEEPFKWDQNSAGVWLSVGVTGLDFTVIGAAIQEVWLPRHGASDVVEFVVEPTRTGVSQLRLCLYHGADLLQSHRLAALVEGPDVPDGQAPSEALASALGIQRERADGFGWLARMEYAAVADLAEPPGKRDVALSLFANDVGGRRVVTVRGKETYEVFVTGDTEDLATDIRTRLDAVSREPISDGSVLYAFRPRDGTPLHSGTTRQRDDALRALAEVGWNLYSATFAGTDRVAMAKDVAETGQIIHVAHSLLENVIPWAAIYDRCYDGDRQKDAGGLPLLRAVCPVGLPDATGTFRATDCGVHDDCPLSAKGRTNAAAAGQGIAEEAIVCGRHFWGFRHIVELPPLQEADDAATGSTGTASAPVAVRRLVTSAARPMGLLFGYNPELGTAAAHSAELDTLLTSSKLAGIWKRETDGDVLLTALRRGDADLVYLFCHARGGKADPTVRPPALVFREGGTGPPSLIRPGALASGVCLSHHPLVILNGCNTAVFSPDALSPFIRTLVRDAQAAGVLGTEIPVFEVLASEVARLFLARFLAGKSAGEALLEVRHDLLARGNPMGLAYTLYAVAELTLVQQTG